MEATDVAYLAGIIDGEGCIMINRFATKRSPIGFQYRVILEISMCEHETITHLAKIFDRPIDDSRVLDSGRRVYKIIWRNQPAMDILEMVLPYLHAKRAQALVAREFHSHTPGRGRTYKLSDFDVLEDFRSQIKQLKTPEPLRC